MVNIVVCYERVAVHCKDMPPRSSMRHRTIRATGVPKSIPVRISWLNFMRIRRPTVQYKVKSHLRMSMEASKAQLNGSGDM